MKEFNLEQALAGKKVVTKNGRVVTDIYYTEHKKVYPVGAISHINGEKVHRWYTKNGKFFDHRDDSRDLMMKRGFFDGWTIKPAIRERFALFATAFIQVALVSLNTVLLSKGQTGPSILVAFLISYVWTFNVKRAAFGSHREKLIYSAGAASGAAVGLYIAGLL